MLKKSLWIPNGVEARSLVGRLVANLEYRCWKARVNFWQYLDAESSRFIDRVIIEGMRKTG